MTHREGACLCGAVKVAGDFADEVLACHCTQCQVWTGGGPLYSVHAKGPVTVTGAARLTRYRASTWGERVSCAGCGSTLWWQMQDRAITSVAAGLFAGQDGLRVTREIFIDTRPDWLPPHAGADQSTEAEEQAKLAAYLKEQSNDHV